MKKVICLFLLFLFVQSKTDIDESIAHFYDIEYNKKYIVDITKYSWGYLPENHRYYFRVAVNENDKRYKKYNLVTSIRSGLPRISSTSSG